MLLEIHKNELNMSGHKRHTTEDTQNNKEKPTLIVNNASTTSSMTMKHIKLSNFLVTWHYCNHFLMQLCNNRMYQFLTTSWDQLTTWIFEKEKWYFPKPSEQYQLLKWVRSLVPTHSVTNFKEDWRDGIVLCALIEGITPGACPRYDVLHPKQEFLNIALGLKLASARLGVKTDLTVPDILYMKDDVEVKLQKFVARLHTIHLLLSKMNPKLCYCSIPSKASLQSANYDTFKNRPNCFVKGMGLMMGVRGREACFNIYFHVPELMDIVIEIKGEGNHCEERITLLSPRRKEFCEHRFSATVPLTAGRTNSIPLKYTIFPKKIAVSYVPPATGHYELSIISRGQPIFGSPFEVRVDSQGAPNLAISYYRHLGTSISRRDSEFGELDGGFTTLRLNSTIKKPKSKDTVKEVIEKVIKYTVLREYDIIELKPGEPLSQDIRAWSALSTGPKTFHPCRDNGILSVSQTTNICQQQSQLKMDDGIDIATKESTGNLDTQSECSENNEEEETTLQEAPQMEKSTEAEAINIANYISAKSYQEQETFEDSNGTSHENTTVDEGRHVDSREGPEGLENNVSTNHKVPLNEQSVISASAQYCNSCIPNLKAEQSSVHWAATPRVPERLISDWAYWCTESGESIVKTRVKEFERSKLV